MELKRSIAAVVLSFHVFSSAVSAQEGPPPFATAQYYWDSRSFNTLGLVLGANRLPLGLTMWGFTDIHGNQHTPGDRYDLKNSYSEYRLYRSIPTGRLGIEGLGAQVEFSDSTPGGNAALRAGLNFRHAIALPGSDAAGEGWLHWHAYPADSNGDGGQLSVAYFFPVHERVRIDGFADLNLSGKRGPRWVVEPQLNVKIIERFWWIVELRYNGFEAAIPGLDGTGWATGLRVDF